MEGRLRPAHVEPFKGMGTIRTNADLHVEDERQRRIGRDVHEDGASCCSLAETEKLPCS